jgi:hypothetical protein
MWSGAENEIEHLHPVARDVHCIRQISGLEGVQR